MNFQKVEFGGLIVFERDIKIKDIVNTGINLEADISPQIIVNLFMPNTPLHDGAIIISNNKINAAACMLPLSSNTGISKRLGMRHRAAVGISEESDAIAVVISEQSGKISIAKDGVLIPDISEQALKQVLIKNLITKRLHNRDESINRLKEIFKRNKKNDEENS